MSVADKLDRVLTRVEELKHLLSTADGGQFGALSKELAELEPVAEKVQVLRAAERARDEAEAMLGDPELRELAEAFGEQLGVTPRFRVAPPLLVRLHPGMRELRETLYSYQRPFVASDAKYAARFGPGTGVDAAVEGTLGWLSTED